MTKINFKIYQLLVLALAVQSCVPSISLFNEIAYQQAVELKVVSMELIEKADEPFGDHQESVSALKLELQKAYEFARGRPNNEFSTEQWQIMIDPDRHLLGGFLAMWEENGALSTVFVQEASANIAAAFDTIIGLESGKIEPTN